MFDYLLRAAQSDFVPGSAFSNLKLCLMDENKHDRYHILYTLTKSYSRPITKLCIAASQSEISDFGQGYEHLIRK